MKYIIALILSLPLIACDKSIDREIANTTLSGNSDGLDGENGINGLDSLVDIVDGAASCPYDGVTVLSGLDLNSNGVLDSNEVTKAKSICNGEPTRKSGLSCNLHDLPSYDSSTSLPQALAHNPILGNFTLPNFSVPDSPSSGGFPGMPANLQALVGIEGYALDCSGYLYVPTSGIHTFALISDDGSRLVIEDNIIIQNQGLHAPTLVTANNINLNQGWNRINMVYYQGPNTQIALELKWTGPITLSQVIPAGLFSHE